MALYSPQSARRSVLNTVSLRAVSQVATMLSYVVLVRALSERSFGIYSLLYAFIPVVSTFASLGLEQTLRRFQPEYLRTGDHASAEWLVRFVSLARLGSNTVLLILILLAWNLVAPLFQLSQERAEFALFCPLILLFFQTRVLEFALASHMLHRYGVGSTAVLSVGKLVAYAVLAWLHWLTLRGAIFADTAAYVLAYIFLRVAYHYQAGDPRQRTRVRPGPAERKRLTRYALFNNFNDAGSILLYVQTDNFFIAALVNPVAVGAYSFYTRLNAMLANLTPTRLFETVVQPMFFAVAPDEAERRIPRYLTFLLNCGLIAQLPIIAYTTVYHREIVDLFFGGKFGDVSWLMPIIVAFGTTSSVISVPVTCVAQYQERASLILLSQLFGIYQIVAMVVLVPIMGLLGAAVATGTFHLFRNLFVWWQVRHMARWLNFWDVVGAVVVIWGGAVAVCFALKRWLALPPLLTMVVGAIVCSAAALLYIRSRALSQSDRDLLAQLFHGRETRLLRWVGVLRGTA